MNGDKKKRVLTILGTFLKFGCFTFGGGWSIVAQIQKEFVEKRRWITDEELLRRTKEDDILVAYQPVFLEYDLHICDDRVGKELGSTSYCFKTAYEMGIHASFGSDCPVEDDSCSMRISVILQCSEIKWMLPVQESIHMKSLLL